MIFLKDKKNFDILEEVSLVIPKGSKAYIYAGTVRNALYFKIFNEKLPQRDFDLIFIGNINKFRKNLISVGFEEVSRKSHQILMRKKKIQHSKKLSDYVYLDINFDSGKNIKTILKDRVNFTVNSFAISIKDIYEKSWDKKVISLPNSLKDLKNKIIKINVIHATSIFALIRLVSMGFKIDNADVNILLKKLKNIEKTRFDRNVKKVFDYCSKPKAMEILKQLGIEKNIYDWNQLKNL
jgi:hypothetical protein